MTSEWHPDSGEYVPIDCDRHSVLELLAMRHTPVVVRARPESGVGTVEVEGEVRDVFTRAGAEYLLLVDREGDELRIRLDRLRGLAEPSGAILWRQKIATEE